MDFCFAHTQLEISTECCVIDGIVFKVTRDGQPLGKEDHETFCQAFARALKEESSLAFEDAWGSQLRELGYAHLDCVVVLFEGTILEVSEGNPPQHVRKAHAVYRRLSFKDSAETPIPYWIPLRMPVVLEAPKRITRRA